jgi:protein TonB
MATTGQLFGSPVTLGAPVARTAASTPADRDSSVRYHGATRSRLPLVAGILTAVALPGIVLLGIRRSHPAAPPRNLDTAVTVSLVMPDLRELEEPEQRPTDDRPETHFEAITTPRLMDAPTVTTSMDFVQAVDFSTIVDKSSLKAGEIVIPDSAKNLASQMGTIFNLADLDRRPEIVLQPDFNYPSDLKRAGIGAHLIVEFIVDENGVTHDPVIIEASVPGFEISARNGILKWRFRPGMKSGAKVSSRMRVPIEFRVER